MTEEFGPPIAVNGKRPEWLGDDERCLPCWDAKAWYPMRGGARVRSVSGWASVSAIRLRADHPYYQSAEYKASVGEPEGCGIKLYHSPVEGVREIYVDGLRVTVAPVFEPRPAMTEAEMIAALEATGHTVTPPDPLAGDREFVAGLMAAMGWQVSWTVSGNDDDITAAMAYLRANKGRL
jgi:hypothetical protein